MATVDLTALLRQQSFIPYFLNHIENSVYIVDDRGCVVFINNKAEQVDGYTTEEIFGLRVQDVYDTHYCPTLEVLKTGKSVDEFAYRYNGNGKEVYQLSSAHPIIISGKLVGACAIQRDITPLKNIIEENLKLQKKLSPSRNKMSLGAVDVNEVFSHVIGKDPRFLDCVSMAKVVARSDSPVLLTGSTGSGKELFAKCIHDASNRKDKPFLAINCSAIPETLLESILFGTEKGIYTGAIERSGLFEQAQGGTLFLDEINSMPLVSQAKLLRVLEEKEIRHLGGQSQIRTDVRIISSSNSLPQDAITKKQIREDLFYRLAVVNIVIPDLCLRKDDILLLTEQFICKYNKQFNKNILDIDEEVHDFFLSYAWPGNVRQLKHCIESAMNFVGDDDVVITTRHLPQYLYHKSAYGYTDLKLSEVPYAPSPTYLSDNTLTHASEDVFSTIANKEKQTILDALLACSGNVTQAAKKLGLNRQTLAYRMKKYEISKK